jgi:hypothetical protein
VASSSSGQGGDTALANPSVLDFGVTDNNVENTDLGTGFGHSEVDASGW